MQPDSLGNAEGMNLYATGGSDSLSLADTGGPINNSNGAASTLHRKLSGGSELLAQANTTVIRPKLSTILPPVFIPGTRENNGIVNSMIGGFWAIGDAAGNIFNTKAPQNPRPIAHPPQPSPPIPDGWVSSPAGSGVIYSPPGQYSPSRRELMRVMPPGSSPEPG